MVLNVDKSSSNGSRDSRTNPKKNTVAFDEFDKNKIKSANRLSKSWIADNDGDQRSNNILTGYFQVGRPAFLSTRKKTLRSQEVNLVIEQFRLKEVLTTRSKNEIIELIDAKLYSFEIESS